MVADRDRLIEILRTTSLKSAPEPSFRLASGKLSRYYVDCKQALYPIAIAISDAVFREAGVKLRVFVVRKDPKTHGIQDLIAGNVMPGDRTLIVDDVVTTAGSTIKAIRRAREARLEVRQALALIDREEEQGGENLAAEGVQFAPLFKLRELLEN
jgi:orotate phosphoribosyltransferase